MVCLLHFNVKHDSLYFSLYRGKVGLDVAEARHLMGDLDWQGAIKEIGVSVNWRKANGSKKVWQSTSLNLVHVSWMPSCQLPNHCHHKYTGLFIIFLYNHSFKKHPMHRLCNIM